MAIVLAAWFGLLTGSPGYAQSSPHSVDPRMLPYLEKRVEARPDDAAAWRMLGRAYQHSGQADQALRALQQAIDLAPRNVAAYFDMATVLQELNRPDEAVAALEQVTLLAPESEYAAQAHEQLALLQPASSESGVVQASYEIKRFDGSQLLRERRHELFNNDVRDEWPPILATMEIGALYNTNVALTPSSREFAAARAESAQLVASPQFEYWLYEGDVWRAGPVFSGDFTLNERDFENLNLQSYRPGAFIERSIFLDGAVVIPRLQYEYTLDQFNGETFDDRHAVTASATTITDAGNSTVAYFTTNLTDFADDGAAPTLSSRDGWTYGAGLNHTYAVQSNLLTAVSIGADVEMADVEGSTFAYNGVATYLAGEVPLTARLSLILEGGWGYRDYHRATISPSRNENIWRGGTRLLFRINEFWSVAAIFKYDRFESENRLFDADRTIGGLVTSFVF